MATANLGWDEPVDVAAGNATSTLPSHVTKATRDR